MSESFFRDGREAGEEGLGKCVCACAWVGSKGGRCSGTERNAASFLSFYVVFSLSSSILVR
jgi:hypothetical protein